MDKYGLMSLFTDTDYQEITYTYKQFEQKIAALKGASTDHDLTGQIIWKAADIFSRYMLENCSSTENQTSQNGHILLGGKSILELGSGPGLGAFISARWADTVILSDYQDLVLELIESNVSKYNPRKDKCQMYSSKIDWMEIEKDEYFKAINLIDGDGTVAGKLIE